MSSQHMPPITFEMMRDQVTRIATTLERIPANGDKFVETAIRQAAEQLHMLVALSGSTLHPTDEHDPQEEGT